MALVFVVDQLLNGYATSFGRIAYNASIACAAFVAFEARKRPRVDRSGAIAMALGTTSWGVGSVSTTFNDLGVDNFFTSLAVQNFCYLLVYPLGIVAIGRLLSRRLVFRWEELLNGAIVGLGIATVASAIVLEVIDIKFTTTEPFVNTVFPIADLVLLSYTLASVLMLPHRNSPRALLLLIGISFFTVSDLYYLTSVYNGTYEIYRWPDIGWVVGFIFIAEAPWRFSEERQSNDRGEPVEAVAAAVALGVICLHIFNVADFQWFALTPAVATVIFAFVRLAIALRQSRRLIDEQILARTDELTGLANRRRFVAATTDATTQWRESERYGCLLLLDLDGFKEVNDTLGHQTGDELLRNIAARLSAAIPRNSLLARLGGDEFGLLLYTTPDGAGALTVAAAIREALAQPVEIAGVRLRVEASIGIALAPEHGLATSDLLRHADVAMYRAKRERLGAVIFDHEIDSPDGDRLNLAEELNEAIEHDQFLVYYQPKIDLKDGGVHELEALVRWQHPRLGFLNAPDFLPIAEKTGAVVDLTRVVLRKVAHQIMEWREAGLDLSIAVNINARELESIQIVELIDDIVSSHNLTSDCLILEITEEVLVKDPATARTIIAALDRLGVRVSIDDFGTGYSSLSYLQHLPVHELKLDRAFVHDLGASDLEAAGRARAVAKSVVDLARSLGMNASAEGVECQEQLLVLRSIDCDSAQGFFFAEPMSAVSVTLWLATQTPVRFPG